MASARVTRKYERYHSDPGYRAGLLQYNSDRYAAMTPEEQTERRAYDAARYQANHADIMIRHSAYRVANRDEISAKQRLYVAKNRDKIKAQKLSRPPAVFLLHRAKHRAKRDGVPFDLSLEDVTIPAVCPVLGIPLMRNLGKAMPAPGSPSLDRLIPVKGYVRGNVTVISHKANTMKNTGTVEELEKIVAWMKKELQGGN